MAGRAGRGPSRAAQPELSSSDDDDKLIDDAFARGANKIAFDGEDDDQLDEEAVYDLSDDESEEESDEEDELDSEEPDLDEEIERGGKAGRRE